MVEKLIMSPRNVIDLARYQQDRTGWQGAGVLDAALPALRCCAGGRRERGRVLEHVQSLRRPHLRTAQRKLTRGVSGETDEVASGRQGRACAVPPSCLPLKELMGALRVCPPYEICGLRHF